VTVLPYSPRRLRQLNMRWRGSSCCGEACLKAWLLFACLVSSFRCGPHSLRLFPAQRARRGSAEAHPDALTGDEMLRTSFGQQRASGHLSSALCECGWQATSSQAATRSSGSSLMRGLLFTQCVPAHAAPPPLCFPSPLLPRPLVLRASGVVGCMSAANASAASVPPSVTHAAAAPLKEDRCPIRWAAPTGAAFLASMAGMKHLRTRQTRRTAEERTSGAAWSSDGGHAHRGCGAVCRAVGVVTPQQALPAYAATFVALGAMALWLKVSTAPCCAAARGCAALL